MNNLATLFQHTESLSKSQAERRCAELLDKSLLVFDEADELQFLAHRLGRLFTWQHRVLKIGDAVGWEEGRG